MSVSRARFGRLGALTLAIAALALAVPGIAAAEGWSWTGSMAESRLQPATALLPGGEVLVAGGHESSTAEIYDPTRGTWRPTGSMVEDRSTEAVVSLPDGRVLLIGGVGDSSSSLLTAEIYDPASGTWQAASPMAEERQYAAAALLPGGRVLVAGGSPSGNLEEATASAEIYDPATNTWDAAASLLTPRAAATAIPLPDGRVLVAGGVEKPSAGDFAGISSTEIYDPGTNTWTAAASLVSPRGIPASVPLPGGGALFAGGSVDGINGLASAEVYDPASGSWAATSPLLTRRVYAAAAPLPGGSVLLAGGLEEADFEHFGIAIAASAEVFDPASRSWTAIAPMPEPRAYPSTVALPDGRVLVAGGVGLGGAGPLPIKPLTSAEIYTPPPLPSVVPPSSTSSAPSPPPPSRISVRFASTAVKQGKVHLTLRCTGATDCAGKVTLTAHGAALGRHGRAAKRAVAIAAHSYRLAAGRSQALVVRLRGSAQRALAHGKLPVKAAATVAGSDTVAGVRAALRLATPARDGGRHGHRL